MGTVFLQVQSEWAQDTIIQPYSSIVFNSVLAMSNRDEIRYDSNTGIIQLNKAGVYFVEWSVVTSAAVQPVITLLQTANGKVTIANSSLNKDQITGSAILTVDSPGFQFVLTNGNGVIQLSAVPAVANLAVYEITPQIETDETPVKKRGCGALVNFQNGSIDYDNPSSWPILLQVFNPIKIREQIVMMQEFFTLKGLEESLGLFPGVLIQLPTEPLISTAIAPVSSAIALLHGNLEQIVKAMSGAGIDATDVYISYSDMGVAPAKAPLSNFNRPLTPQIIAKDGVITTFAAELDCIAYLEAAMLTSLAEAILNWNNTVEAAAAKCQVFTACLSDMSTTLAGIGSPLPADFEQQMNHHFISKLSAGMPEAGYQIHAVLWLKTDHGTAWLKVNDLELGVIHPVSLVPFEELLLNYGSGTSTDDIVTSMLGFLGSRNGNDHAPKLRGLSGHEAGIYHPVFAGDELIVQFTLQGGDQTTVMSGVMAANAMASVAIDCIE